MGSNISQSKIHGMVMAAPAANFAAWGMTCFCRACGRTRRRPVRELLPPALDLTMGQLVARIRCCRRPPERLVIDGPARRVPLVGGGAYG